MKEIKYTIMEVSDMNVGIIGLGNIAKRVAHGVHCANNATLYAVASREIQTAMRFKEEFTAQKAFGSYEELLQDEQVDVVYVCTPNPLHYEHILLCLKYHKHVICEKPMVSSTKQVEECFAYAKKQGCFLMEAEKTLFTPLNQKIKKMVDEGAIGKLRYIEAGYGSDMNIKSQPKDSWLFHEVSGGSFYDVGVYPICYANYFANCFISKVQVMKQMEDETQVDMLTQAMLKYENGIMAYVRSSWNQNFINCAYLYGSDGVIITKNFWKNTKAVLQKDGVDTIIEVKMESDFAGEISHACDCIAQGLLESPILSHIESMEIMRVLEEMHGRDCVQ